MAGEKRGYVHVYTGDGKGKTTAAIGLAVRASGHDRWTYIGQFMKGQHYGELAALEHLPQVTIEQYGDEGCIRKEEVTAKHVEDAVAGLERARNAMISGKHDIVVLDEVNVALWFGLLTEDAAGPRRPGDRYDRGQTLLLERCSREERDRVLETTAAVPRAKTATTAGRYLRVVIRRSYLLAALKLLCLQCVLPSTRTVANLLLRLLLRRRPKRGVFGSGGCDLGGVKRSVEDDAEVSERLSPPLRPHA